MLTFSSDFCLAVNLSTNLVSMDAELMFLV